MVLMLGSEIQLGVLNHLLSKRKMSSADIKATYINRSREVIFADRAMLRI
jgi:hypothetical protein